MLEKLPNSSTEDIDVISIGSEHIDLRYLRQFASEFAPDEISISSIQDQLRQQQWDDESVSGLSPASILDEFQRLGDIDTVLRAHPDWLKRIGRIQAADYSFPILLYKGIILDGLHRTLHAIIEKNDSISAHSFTSLPKQAFVSSETIRQDS